MCAFQKNALAYIDKKCMMFDRKGNHAIPSFTWNSHHRNCSRLGSLMAGTRSPNLTSMTQMQDLRCSWQFLLLSRGQKLFDGSASDPAAVTVPPPLGIAACPLLPLLWSMSGVRPHPSSVSYVCSWQLEGKLVCYKATWQTGGDPVVLRENQLPLFVSTSLTVKTMVLPTWNHNLESKHLTAATFQK